MKKNETGGPSVFIDTIYLPNKTKYTLGTISINKPIDLMKIDVDVAVPVMSKVIMSLQHTNEEAYKAIKEFLPNLKYYTFGLSSPNE